MDYSEEKTFNFAGSLIPQVLTASLVKNNLLSGPIVKTFNCSEDVCYDQLEYPEHCTAYQQDLTSQMQGIELQQCEQLN